MHYASDVAMGMVLCSLLSAPIQAADGPDEKAQCAAQLKTIHQAIQEYRQEHKAMPNREPIDLGARIC